MSIPINTQCLECHLTKSLAIARSRGSDETAMAFARELLNLYQTFPEGASSAWFSPHTSPLFLKYYQYDPDDMQQERIESNQFVLDRLEDIRRRVTGAKDPVLAGLQFSILGNYLDFSALRGKVDFSQLDKMMDDALEMELDQENYVNLCKDLEQGKKLLYLTDNAGEIGFDRIFAEVLQAAYPHLQITFCVRGMPVHNDATREDAALMGIPFPVIDNGNGYGGTVIEELSQEAKTALEEADVIIAKGMGNTESMYGCGYNVYYAFLVKCSRFVDVFQKPLMSPALIKERK